MKEAVLQVLDAAVAFAPAADSAATRFRVEWEEPDGGAVRQAVARLQADYIAGLPEKKRVYLEASLPRFRFVVQQAVRYFPKGGKVLDLGCAPGFMGNMLHNLGYEMHGIDLNTAWEETYPDRQWLEELHVQAIDVEKQALPFADCTFDGAVFTEVLEHIAFAKPVDVLNELTRVLKPGGSLLLTTPNVCNLANILALAKGKNIFWAPEIFYGSSDRHNREYTPAEVVATVEAAGLEIADRFRFNGPNNWNGASIDHMYETLDLLRGLDSSLLGNTIFVIARRPGTSQNA